MSDADPERWQIDALDRLGAQFAELGRAAAAARARERRRRRRQLAAGVTLGAAVLVGALFLGGEHGSTPARADLLSVARIARQGRTVRFRSFTALSRPGRAPLTTSEQGVVDFAHGISRTTVRSPRGVQTVHRESSHEAFVKVGAGAWKREAQDTKSRRLSALVSSRALEASGLLPALDALSASTDVHAAPDRLDGTSTVHYVVDTSLAAMLGRAGYAASGSSAVHVRIELWTDRLTGRLLQALRVVYKSTDIADVARAHAVL